MKKNLLIMLIIGIIVFGIYSFSKIYFEPPMPEVSIKNTKVPTTQGSYCWKVLGFGRCVDKIYSSPFEMGSELTPIGVMPNSEIKIQFESKPLSGSLVVELWLDENTKEIIEIKNNKIKVPSQKGVYIYHITSNWKQGDSSYAFSVEVE